MKLICSIFLTLFLIQSVKGQELYGRYLDHQQGLLSKECYDIITDKKGYLLISTQYGPVKYDGEKSTPICTNLPIEERIIYDFEKAPNGTIYLLNSKNQLFELRDDKAFLIGPKKIVLKGNQHSFTKLHWTKSGLYIFTYDVLLKYSFKSRKIQPFYKNISDRRELLTYSYQPDREFPFFKYPSSEKFINQDISIHFPGSGQVFEYTSGAIVDSREDQVTVGETTYLLIGSKLFQKKGNHVISLNLTRILFIEKFHNRIWLCTYSGLLELDLNGKLLHHHFKGEIIGGVCPLKSGGIAVSFNRKGVFICTNIHNRIYPHITASSVARIHPFNLIGTTHGQIYQYKQDHLSKLARVDSLGYAERVGIPNAIHEMSTFGNKLLITSTNGIYYYKPNFQLILKKADRRMYYFGIIIRKDFFYFILRGGIIKSTWKHLTSLSYRDYRKQCKTIYLQNVQCHIFLNDSILLLGTDDGLFRLNLITERFQRSSLFKPESGIRSLKRTTSGELVVFSRYKGIFVFKKNKQLKYIPAPCISVMDGLIYKDNLVIQGNDGVYIKPMNYSENIDWVKLFNGETKSIFALQNNLLISYENDLIITRPEGYKKDETPVILNSIQLGETKTNAFPSEIPPNKSITLDFDILKFGADKLDLYYRLKGNSTFDQVIKGTQINFDALKSGEYDLEVYPIINGKIQFKHPVKYHFNVQTTFWESTVFYIIIGILVLSFVFSIFLFVNLRRKRRSAERSKLESKLNEYKLLAVKAQVNPHFLSNGLAAIQALILKGNNDNAAHYLAKFSYLMRKILYYSETQFISINQELELTDAYLELELLRFRNRFEIRKEIDLSESQLNEFHFPSLLLQPILENAIWHGLKFQENNPQLLISFKINQNQELVVLISDNGPGFNLSNQSEEHLSKGNKLISERIDALNKQFQKPVASMEVISSGSGTKVIFIFSPQLYKSNPI
nr:histidine kinase [uncultured Fluviicola sp.]